MTAQELYTERMALINKALALEPVERIPALYMGIAPAAKQMGVTMAQYCAEPDVALSATLDYVDKLGTLDGINLHPPTNMTWLLTAIWFSHILTPGQELAEDDLWQVAEAEVMKPDEYKVLIDNGYEAFQQLIFPRVIDLDFLAAGQKYLVESGNGVYRTIEGRGYVPLSCGITTIPFEMLCGARSMQEFFLDLYRRPDEVQAAMDVMVPDLIGLGVGTAQLLGVPRVWLGGWRAASAMLAPKLWDRFVWPYYKTIANGLIDAGVTPIFHWDQDWTRDLARLRELPAKSCALNPDGMTDVRKAKEVLGDHMAIVGDVPSSIFAAGTPADVREYVRSLVADVGPEGLILCPGCDAPINTKAENMEAFAAACVEFGKGA
ncbi:MAG TPA: uroporphyrinogen decarboxylase family protein [Acidimicrobiales bacterium]|nr:uroporphyrinogen decarboxylase family protein [Acidimicrobiales bacterium]